MEASIRVDSAFRWVIILCKSKWKECPFIRKSFWTEKDWLDKSKHPSKAISDKGLKHWIESESGQAIEVKLVLEIDRKWSVWEILIT